jgi:hypothetical protein
MTGGLLRARSRRDVLAGISSCQATAKLPIPHGSRPVLAAEMVWRIDGHSVASRRYEYQQFVDEALKSDLAPWPN